MDTLGTSWSVLIKEVSLFQRLFSTLLYVVGTRTSILIRGVSLYLKVLNWEVPLYVLLKYFTAKNFHWTKVSPVPATFALRKRWNKLCSWHQGYHRLCVVIKDKIDMAKFFGYTYGNSQIVPSLSQFHSNLCSIPIPGPFGERDEEQVFIQRVIPETSSIFIRHSSTGNRYSIYMMTGKAYLGVFWEFLGS